MTDPVQTLRPRRNPQTAFRDFGDEGGLVVIPGKSEVKVLNAVAMAIYPLLDGNHTREEIIAKILDDFEITPEEARKDLDDFLGELAEHGMLADSEND